MNDAQLRLVDELSWTLVDIRTGLIDLDKLIEDLNLDPKVKFEGFKITLSRPDHSQLIFVFNFEFQLKLEQRVHNYVGNHF